MIFKNIKMYLELVIILAFVDVFLRMVKKSGKIGQKIRKTMMKSHLAQYFHPYLRITIDYIKEYYPSKLIFK